MKKFKCTPFGAEVKKKLIDLGETQNWLILQIRKKTGLYVDSGYMYKILTGQRNVPRIVQAIREILDIPETEAD